VERALEAYEIREAGRQPAAAFDARLAKDYGSDLDLEVAIRETRKINPEPEFDLPRHQRHLGNAAQDTKPAVIAFVCATHASEMPRVCSIRPRLRML
jgi:hypothetical protein